MHDKKNKTEASHEDYLRFFFEHAKVSVQERVFLEESFELCFNNTVPKDLKIDLNCEKTLIKIRDTDPSPPPSHISSTAPTPVILSSIIVVEVDKSSSQKTLKSEGNTTREIQMPHIPKAPKVPELTLVGRVLLDSAQNNEYVLTHKESGEHVSLGFLINQLKVMTGIE